MHTQYAEMMAAEAEREYMEGFAPLATMSDAHYEWHVNAGVPMGEPCPMDACHQDWYPTVNPTPSGVKCGNRSGYHPEGFAHHATVAEVRECYGVSA